MASTVSILHFNDVYNIEGFEREPVGGAARLASKFKEYESLNPLIVFSGDCFNPSVMSTVTKGKQMVPVLNTIGVHVAALGNHDLDHGLGVFEKLKSKCNFPWLLSNVLDKETGIPLGGVKKHVILEWGGVRLGFFGLAEEDWIATLTAVDPGTLQYLDFVQEATEQCKELRAAGAEVVIALTHMRLPNDRLLAEQVEDIDLILGGHDHESAELIVPPYNTPLIKSGCDFKQYSLLTLEVPARAGNQGAVVKPKCTWKQEFITSEVPEDPQMKEIVHEFNAVMGAKMEKRVGWAAVDLDGRFASVRTGETNLGNFICDVWRQVAHVDIVLLNSGTLRSDMIHAAGPIKMKDVMAILPMADTTAVLECPGSVVLQALENGVSQYPKVEGRFPQVSGISFTFDPQQPPRSRIVPGSVIVGTEPLQPDKLYTLATKGYLTHGKDGYDCFVDCKVVVSEELGCILNTIMCNHFRMLKVLDAWEKQDVVSLTRSHWCRLVKTRKQKLQNAGGAPPSRDTPNDHNTVDLSSSYPVTSGSIGEWDASVGCYVIRPVTSGRINKLGDTTA